MPATIIPDVIAEQTVRALGASDTALAAARMMAEHDISAVVVVDDTGSLAGIVTERDLSRRVVGEDRRGSELALEEIMTRDPVTAAPADSPAEVLAHMRKLRIRHIPVTRDGTVLGVVSIRDLQHSIGHQIVSF